MIPSVPSGGNRARLRQGSRSSRGRHEREETLYSALSVVLGLALVLFAIGTFRDFGITYDEPKDHGYGRLLWQFYVSGFKDRSLLSYHDLWLYGGLFELLAWPISKLTWLGGEYEARHLLNAATGLVGVLGVYKLGSAIMGKSAGFWSALFLAICPAYLGHMFNNPKDIPFAAGYTWSLYYIYACYAFWPRGRPTNAAKAGAAIGLTMAIRVGGVMLIAVMSAMLLLAAAPWRWGLWGKRLAWHSAAKAGGVLLATFVISYLLMIVLWPYALLEPVTGPITALIHFNQFPWTGKILFGGRLIDSGGLPPDYIPRLLALKLPEIVPVAIAAGMTMAAMRLRMDWKLGRMPKDRRLSGGIFMLAISVMLPVGYAILSDSILYNGMRHFLFVIPPIACLAGCSTAAALRKAGKAGRKWRAALALAMGIYFLWHISILARIHPHQIAYFNMLAGGMKGAFNKYELDYWGNSYSELTRRFLSRLRAEGKGVIVPCRIVVTGPYDSAGYYLPPECSMVGPDDRADFVFFLTNAGPPVQSARIYAIVERFGVPLAAALDMRKDDLDRWP